MLVKRLKTRGREVQQQEYAENALIRDSDLSGGRGGSRIFFRRGCTRLLLYFNTNKPHSFLFFLLQNTSCIRKPQVISGGGGGAHPLHPPPRSAPALDSALSSF